MMPDIYMSVKSENRIYKPFLINLTPSFVFHIYTNRWAMQHESFNSSSHFIVTNTIFFAIVATNNILVEKY